MDKSKVPGLRLFLLTMLQLNSEGIREKCEQVENEFSKGVATELYKRHARCFDDHAFNTDYLQVIDDYYKSRSGCADGNEYFKYSCTQTDGIALNLDYRVDVPAFLCFVNRLQSAGLSV